MRKVWMTLLCIALCVSAVLAGDPEAEKAAGPEIPAEPRAIHSTTLDDAREEAPASAELEKTECLEPSIDVQASGPACSALCEEPPYGGCCTQASQCAGFCSGQGEPRCTSFGCCICL